MKKWLLMLLSFLTVCTLALTTGCGGPKLEGKWVGMGPHFWVGHQVAAVIEINKVKDLENNYLVKLHFEGYNSGLGSTKYVWQVERDEEIPMVYSKDKQMLMAQGKEKGLILTYKDGKWTMPQIGLFGGPFVFEEYSDSVMQKVRKACQDELKQQAGDRKVEFTDPKK